MQFSAIKTTTLLFAGLSSLALGAPATTPAANDADNLLDKRCDCECNKRCQHNCLIGFIGIGAGACVLSCAPNCGCSENSKC